MESGFVRYEEPYYTLGTIYMIWTYEYGGMTNREYFRASFDNYKMTGSPSELTQNTYEEIRNAKTDQYTKTSYISTSTVNSAFKYYLKNGSLPK